jgi:hypothetical protein
MSTQDTEDLDKSHSQSLMDAGMYVFMDAVSAESMKPIIEWILFENHLAKVKKKELLLMICSEFFHSAYQDCGPGLHSQLWPVDIHGGHQRAQDTHSQYFYPKPSVLLAN